MRKECDELGEAAVEARLKKGGFADDPSGAAYEWLIERRAQSERVREQRAMKYTQLTVYGSWALVLITILGVFWQKDDAREQREQAKESFRVQLEQQRKDIQAQHDDAKELLRVQISVELDKQFDSREMRQARRRLAAELLNKKKVTETRVLDFFDKLGMYTEQKRIDQDTVYSSYSYWVERYWPALKKAYVEQLRQEENDPGYYASFEALYDQALATDAKESGKSAKRVAPSQKKIRAFLLEESTLPQ